MSRDRRPWDVVVLGALLLAYPRRFRDTFADELLALYRHRRNTARATRRPRLAVARLAVSTWGNCLVECPLAWRDAWRRPKPISRRSDSSMSLALYELRLAARTLFGRHSAFALLCVLTLALGLGATTAIFSVVHGVLLAPLPYGDPDRIVLLHETRQHEGTGEFNGLNFVDLRDRATSFDAMAGYYAYRPEGIDATGADPVERLRILRVGSGYFEALGVEPIVGRTFSRAEEIPPGAAERDLERFAMVTAPSSPIVVLSHDYWQQRFAGDRQAVGRTLELDRQPYTIVGVMPDGLGHHVGGHPDVWLPLDLGPGGVNVRGNHYLAVVGRLKADVSIEQARSELDHLATQMREVHSTNENLTFEIDALGEVVVGPSRSMLGLLLAAVGAMLAIACINVANLFFGRSVARRRELGLRAALGAGRRRLFAQTLAECFWIALGGGVLGWLIAGVAVRWLVALRPEALPRFDAVGLHWPVLVVSILAMTASMFVFGLAPGVAAARADGRLAFGDRSTIGLGDRRHRRVQDLTVCVQVALALVLLVAGSLLTRSFSQLHGTDLGFDPERALTFQLRLPDYAYDQPERRIAFYDQLFERLAASPDIAAAGATSMLPATGHRNHWGFRIDGVEPTEGNFPVAEIRCVAGDAIGALAIPRFAGRSVGQADRSDGERVVAINRALAERYFPGRDPLGERLVVGGPPARTIVGVIADARHDHREEAVPKIYVPQPQFATSRNWDLSFVVARHTESTSWLSIRNQIEATIQDIDPRLAAYDVRTLAAVAAEPIARQRFAAQMMVVFAVASTTLAVVGLFGTLASTLRRRRAEIGVRMALGADRGRVLLAVIGHGLAVCAAGLVLGVGGVWVVRRWLSSLLHDVAPHDPTAWLMAMAVLMGAAAVAAAEPARRAARMDPAEILRDP